MGTGWQLAGTQQSNHGGAQELSRLASLRERARTGPLAVATLDKGSVDCSIAASGTRGCVAGAGGHGAAGGRALPGCSSRTSARPVSGGGGEVAFAFSYAGRREA